MSETKEATYKSLLQRMVHMTEQRDFDEDLMKEVYGALLPPRKFEAANEKVSRLTAERDDLSRKLAVAEGELTIARQEWDDQYAKFIKVATERDEYVTRLNRAQQKLAESTSERIRDHAPAARYPKVVEFLDAVGDGPWSMSAGVCEGKASYYVESRNIKNGTWFAGNSLAAACRAALDSRKERADG